ncbi:MAG: helicase-related protein [Erysipelotrichaceae bacterium]|nr:helicase-related protein [Erysipelotrichaceae bacterium]
MKCPRCLNEDPRYFYLGSKGYYCRRCIKFKRVLIDESINLIMEQLDSTDMDVDYQLNFALTPLQRTISDKLAIMIDDQDTLVYASCGAGKTEIVMKTISEHLKKGLRVGYTTPRRQVAIEVGLRMKRAFSKLNVVIVCEGYTDKTHGDLVVCTTHQLYRYFKFFDILIIDEPDAFPFYKNVVLKGIAKTACIGHYVYLTATPDEELLPLNTLKLFKRPHGYDIPVPQSVCLPKSLALIRLIFWMKNHRRALIFVPTIKMADKLSRLFKVPSLSSKTLNKDEVINKFKQRKISYIICTTILERGVTFSDIDVCIYHADHIVFNLASLIQIMGRIGRDMNYPNGDGLMLCFRKEKKIDECIKRITMMNV